MKNNDKGVGLGNGQFAVQDKPSSELRELMQMVEKNDLEKVKEVCSGLGFDFDQLQGLVVQLEEHELSTLIKVMCKIYKKRKSEKEKE